MPRNTRIPNLSVNTAAPVSDSNRSGITVSDTGSLRGDGISVSMAGMKIVAGGTPAAASSSESGPSGEGGVEWLRSLEDVCVLGEGSSGFVKLVRHRTTPRRRYALKVVALGCAEQERKQILMELRTLHKCNSPNIIAFHDAFYAEGAVHVVLEYMDCGSLADVLQRHGPLPEAMLARIALAVLTGLAHLHHELKTVHRDIKPSNLLLNSRGEAKIGDFGMSGQLASSFSRLASWVGTAAYMSPERISASDYSFAADIWGLGISLWECAVGRYPHATPAQGARREGGEGGAGGEGGGRGGPSHSLLPEEQRLGLSFWDLLHCIVDMEPPALPATVKGVSFAPPFTAFVSACLAKDQTARPSAEALLAHPWLTESEPHLVDISTWLKKTHEDDEDALVSPPEKA